MSAEIQIDPSNAVFGTSVRRKRTYGSLGSLSSPALRNLANTSPKPSSKGESTRLSRPLVVAKPVPIATTASRSNSVSARTQNSADRSVDVEPPRPDSPDLETILARTPRPRRASLAFYSPSAPRLRTRSLTASTLSNDIVNKKSNLNNGPPIIKSRSSKTSLEDVDEDANQLDSDDGIDLDKQVDGDGSESDSSIDIHTPLPHLMFRDGLLSPRSKLLPKGLPFLDTFIEEEPTPSINRSRSVLSNAPSVNSIATTNSIFSKDPRDTQRRRIRHKDKNLLRAGMGLTTGLGWSDSEDEDAPSLLTRRLITTSLARRASFSPIASRPTSEFTDDSPGRTTPSISPSMPGSTLRKVPGRSQLNQSTSSHFSSVTQSMYSSIPNSISEVSLSDATTTRSRSRTQSNASAASTVSASSASHSASQSASTSTLSTSPPPSITPRPLHLVRSASTHLKTLSTTSLSSNRSSSSFSHGHTRSVQSSPFLSYGLTPPRPSHLGSHTAPSSTLSTPERAMSPTSRTRPPVAVVGPRPKPRTGTGMVYRTSSYSSLQGAAMRIRSMSAAASNGDRVGAI